MLKQAEIYDTNNTYYDGQLIQYNRITIPCCMQCNSIDYAQLESEIRNAFTIGYEEVIKLQTATLFTWLCKIHYGLRFLKQHKNTTTPTRNEICQEFHNTNSESSNLSTYTYKFHQSILASEIAVHYLGAYIFTNA